MPRRFVRSIVKPFGLLSAVMVGLLSGCNTIEHRSEEIVKKPLVPLAHSQYAPQLLWSSTKSGGTGKTDAKLRLATTSHAIITADSKGNLLAQDQSSGKILWEKKTNSTITSGPTVVGNSVLVGTRDKGLLAFQADSGEALWSAALPGEILAAPEGNQGVIFANALDGSISALKTSDGTVLWRHSLATPPIVLRHSSSPVVAGNQVFVGFANGRLLALHRMDGSVSWEKEIAVPRGRSDMQRMTDISADPVVRDGVIYVVSYQGRLAALNAESGTPIWEKEMSSYAGFAISKTALFVADAKGNVLAINRRTGKTIWEQSGLQGRRLSKPQIWGNLIVVGDDEGYLHGLSMEDGNFLSRLMVDSKGIEAEPKVLGNTLYILGRGGKVAAYRLGSAPL